MLSNLFHFSFKILTINYSFYGIGPKTRNQLYHHKYATNETFTYYLQHEATYGEYLKNKQKFYEKNENNEIDDGKCYA